MKQTIKLFAVLCMTLIVVLLMASCDDLSNKLPFGDETTPAETTPAATTPEETTPEVTTPEETTPEVTTPEETVEAHEHVWEEWTTLKEATCGVEGMKQRSCKTCPEVEYFSVVPTQNHLYNNECDTDCNACGATREVFNHQYGGDCDATCNVIGCGFVREAGEHQYDNDCDATCNVCSKARVAGHDFVDGACTECGVALGVFENTSVYDNDGDGKNDVYLFTPIIPEKFTGEDVIHVWGGDYVPELSSSYVSASFFGDIRHWYCTEGMGEYFTYKVTVDEAGIYEMAIHTRLKDTRARGAKFTVNAGAENEYSFEISFQFATDEEVSAAMENNYTRTSYMYGIQIELQAGDNYIKIEEASMVDWSLHWRDFYFVKVDDEIPHEHEFVDGKCECGFVPPVLENESVYDNDGDGKNDVYLFTAALPEKFRGENVVSVWCMDYIPELSTSYVSDKNMFSTIYTMYCEKEFDEYFTYKVTVPEAGVYEMAIHTRLKDTRARGAKFIINKDTANEYAFELSYQFATDEELFAAMENDYTRTSYMYSIRVGLQAGDNYIRVEGPTQDLRVFYFRDFYFVKVADLCTEHTWGEWVTVTEPNCEEDGLQKRTCTKCYATEEAPIDDLAGFHVWRNPQTIKTQLTPCLQEWFDQCVCSNCGAVKSTNTRLFSTHKWGLTKVVKAPTCQEDGLTQKSCTVCGAVSETVTKASDHQWSKWQLINDIPCGEEGSQSERVCQTCGAKETHDNERACYVWINHTTLELGTCIQPGKVSEECQYCGKVQIRELQMAGHKWSEYVEVKPASCTAHGKETRTCTVCGATSTEQIYKLDHKYENGICVSCGRAENAQEPIPVVEKTSNYDNDGDGVNDVYFFTTVLPERFEGEGAIHLWMDEYEKDLSSSYVPHTVFSGHPNHVYFDEGKGQYAVYKITVAEAGVYEMAIHTRLKDTYERGGKYTVNEGTEYEYSFETSFQFATDEEVYAARENEYTMSSYMYGMYLELQEGDNYIKIELASGGEKSMHWREFFFVKVEE